MRRNIRFGMVLSQSEKATLTKIAEIEGGLSKAAVIRRLIQREAYTQGILPLPESSNQTATVIDQEVNMSI